MYCDFTLLFTFPICILYKCSFQRRNFFKYFCTIKTIDLMIQVYASNFSLKNKRNKHFSKTLSSIHEKMFQNGHCQLLKYDVKHGFIKISSDMNRHITRPRGGQLRVGFEEPNLPQQVQEQEAESILELELQGL